MTQPTPSGDLQPGQRFHHYTVQRCLGRSHQARVYRAEDPAGSVVALKVFSLKRAEGTTFERFLREGRRAAQVRHRHLVPIHALDVHERAPYLVMDCLEGSDWEHHAASSASDDGTWVDRALAVVSGLGALHAAGVVHRNIKPSNLFLTPEVDGSFFPTILEFGSFRSLTMGGDGAVTETQSGLAVPRLRYVPPESLRGTRDLTPHADQYALAVALFEMVAGCSPYADAEDSSASLLGAIASGRALPLRAAWARADRQLEKALQRAMAVEPADRFPDILEFGRALVPLATDSARARALLPPGSVSPWARARRRRALSWTLGAASAFGLWWWLRAGEEAPPAQPVARQAPRVETVALRPTPLPLQHSTATEPEAPTPDPGPLEDSEGSRPTPAEATPASPEANAPRRRGSDREPSRAARRARRRLAEKGEDDAAQRLHANELQGLFGDLLPASGSVQSHPGTGVNESPILD